MILSAPCGKLEGLDKDGFHSFQGIPYAKPPIGPRRFLPPESLPPREGVRKAIHLGHASPQLYVKGLSSLSEEETLDEDCLFLNVYTPETGGNHPVLFWIHGGAFQKGSGTMCMDPKAFVKEGIVVVSVNYRLGALGFMDMSFLGEKYRESGNDGLLDILCALKWVQENISSFGGDPSNVTIMGQSAGSKICSTLTLMKKAKGLFQKAVCMSGGVQCIRSRHTAGKVAEEFLKGAELTKENAGALLTMKWEKILEAQKSIFAGLNLHTVGPVFDGINFEGNDALSLLEEGKARDISILLGTNRDEMELYWHVYGTKGLDEKLAEKLFGTRAAIVLSDYEKIPEDENDHKNFIHFFTEYIYHAPALRMAKAAAEGGQKVYLYRLDWDRQSYKACHGSETQFLMGIPGLLPDIDHSEAQKELTRKMRTAFISFIKKGKPEAEGLPEWPLFEGKQPKQMTFDEICRVEKAPEIETDPAMPFGIFELDETDS